jgi:5-methylcytosine-specific restriction endonuclease McrA
MNATNRAWFLSIRTLPGETKQRQRKEARKRVTPPPNYEQWLAALKREDSDWSRLCFAYEYRCLCCCRQTILTRDHVKPKRLGGLSHISNYQALCWECNQRKADRHIDYRDGRSLLERPQKAEEGNQMKAKYHTLRSGAVVDDSGGIVYESLEADGVRGRDIARILNEYDRKGIELDWEGLSEIMEERGLLPREGEETP